ncbi:MAG: aspartate--ammonia ligase, partial [Erysipelotrichaceae bacterium]|nr:aspartate--ammonia ligase [Erysipelotrichaceae bacterium]
MILPDNYRSCLDLLHTEIAIKLVKDTFERQLAAHLSLTRVSAPLMVYEDSGLNDNLNGYERPIDFDVPALSGRKLEIVHSLAKWKRMALKNYGIRRFKGIYTDMNAIRRDEELDNLHSIYVDQWDWEAVINKEDRTLETLESYV